MKKRILAVLLSATLCLSAIAVTGYASGLKKGDLNDDGKITAADARTALRGSAGLENLSSEQISAADVNGDKRITAADARIILRVSAGLESFTEEPSSEQEEEISSDSTTELPTETTEPDTGIQTTDYPSVIDSFFAGSFYLDGTIFNEDTGDYTKTKIASDKNLSEYGINMNGLDISFFKNRTGTYMKLIGKNGKKYYIEKNALSSLGLNLDELDIEISFGSSEKYDTPVLTKGSYNGTQCDIYTFNGDADDIAFYVSGNDVICISVIIDGSALLDIELTEFSASAPSDMLTLDGYTKIGIATFISIMSDYA